MKILKVLVECSRCNYEWWSHGQEREACPVCGRVNVTGWSPRAERREIARTSY